MDQDELHTLNKTDMRILLAMLTIVLGIVPLRAQSYTVPTDPTAEMVIPPSSQAWQFAKYGEYPVNRSTGVPSISIPIHEIKVGPISVPIGLSYHAGGIKVDEKASWVGLGWNLSAGGMISRVVKGHPDEHEHGHLNRGIPSSINPLTIDDYEDVAYMNEGFFDTEPDMFNYNFNGVSGKFYFKNSDTIITLPSNDLKIEYENTGYSSITAFKVTTPDGTIYEFDLYENVTYRTKIDLFYTAGQTYWTASSAWYLTKIKSEVYNDSVMFTYNEVAVTDDERFPVQSETIKLIEGGSGYTYTTEGLKEETGYPNSYSGIRFLDEITYSTGKVEFISASDRTNYDSKEPRLTSVKIYGFDDELLRTFKLDNDQYFTSTGGDETRFNYRLKLDSVWVEANGGAKKPAHKFTYLTSGYQALPPRYDTSQDYWGYNNGEPNTSLIPEIDYGDVSPYDYVFGSGNDLDPVESRMKAGIINTITYPTDGYTQFEFEANDIREDGVNVEVGGLRVKSIKSYSESGQLATQKHFIYKDIANTAASSGVYNANYTPNPLSYLGQMETRSKGIDGNGTCYLISDYYVSVTSRPKNMVGYPCGDIVTYKYVTEIFESTQSDYGKSVYEYDTYLDGTFSFLNGFTIDKSQLRGQLRQETHYDEYGNKVKKKSFEYSTDEIDAVKGYKIGKLFEMLVPNNCWECSGTPGDVCILSSIENMYLDNSYWERSYWKHLDNEIEITYGTDGDSLIVVTDYEYNGTDHQQITNQTVNNSDGNQFESKIKYPLDYAEASRSAVLNTMISRNILSSPIEQIYSVDTDVVNAKATEYQIDATLDLVLPKAQYVLETTAPIGSFTESSNGTTFTSYSKWADFTDYDSVGNLSSYSREKDICTSFLWGYNSTLPIAKVSNAISNEIFYSSFEEEVEIDGWPDNTSLVDNKKHSGTYSIKSTNTNYLSGEIFHGLPKIFIDYSQTTKYRFSGWVYSEGPSVEIHALYYNAAGTYLNGANISTTATKRWVYLEKEIDIPTTAKQLRVRLDNNQWTAGTSDGIVYYDDIRLYPVDAEMTTYTHTPWIGITSVSDQNDQTIHYEYDEFGRLEEIKDADNNTVQENKYNYANQ